MKIRGILFLNNSYLHDFVSFTHFSTVICISIQFTVNWSYNYRRLVSENDIDLLREIKVKESIKGLDIDN